MEKKTSEKMLFIRCKQTGFATLIPESDWNAHDALFHAGWDVTDPVTGSPIEPPVTPAAPIEQESAPAKKADKA